MFFVQLRIAGSFTGCDSSLGSTLTATTNNALGTNAAGTTIASGATLDLQNVTYSTTEALTTRMAVRLKLQPAHHPLQVLSH
jgi:hypothetical protein